MSDFKKSVNVCDETAELTDYDFYFNGVLLTVAEAEDEDENEGIS